MPKTATPKDTKDDNSSKLDSAKMEAIKTALAGIKKDFGEGAIMQLGEAQKIAVEMIPTGSISLDLALGGGLPRGRVIEIYGPESSGKTTLALHVIAEAQKKNGVCAFVDAEHALDPEYAKKIGVKVDDLLISQPDNGEQALEIVERLVSSNALDVIVIDSVAALTPRLEIEGEMGDQQMGLHARLMSKALRKLTSAISQSKTAVIFINQLRMKIGIVFGNPETTTGGNALKFYSSVRLDIRKMKAIDIGTGDTKEFIGNHVKVKVVKNKVAPPFRIAEFDIMFNKGINYEGEIIDLAEKRGIVKRAGASYTFGENKLGVGRTNVVKMLEGDKKLVKELEIAIKKWKPEEQD